MKPKEGQWTRKWKHESNSILEALPFNYENHNEVQDNKEIALLFYLISRMNDAQRTLLLRMTGQNTISKLIENLYYDLDEEDFISIVLKLDDDAFLVENKNVSSGEEK
jgi:hypothetical protein